MRDWLNKSGLDYHFVQLAVFMSMLVWPWLLLTTFFVASFAWRQVLLYQAIALPFSILGWAAGFRLGYHLEFQPRWAAMVAGWVGLIWAEIGLALILRPWFGSASIGPGLWAFPALAVLVTIGVLWLFRAETWPKVDNEGTSA